jgi:hypothetical protein
MSGQYNILWIDDEYKELEDLEIHAERYGIILHGFTSFEEGFNELESNLEYYDGVLLDAMFYEHKGQEKGTEDSKGLSKAMDQLIRLENRKKLPMFVLSGKVGFTHQENEMLSNKGIYCYEKGNNNDLMKLFKDIPKQAKKLY